MVLFTFNGPITDKSRKDLIRIFPAKIWNPLGQCPITITIFVIGKGKSYEDKL